MDSAKGQQPNRSMLRKILWRNQAPAEPSPKIMQNNDDQGATEADPDQDWTPSTYDERNNEGENNNAINNENNDPPPPRRSTRTRIPTREFLESVAQQDLEFPPNFRRKNIYPKHAHSMRYRHPLLLHIIKRCTKMIIRSKTG